MLFIYSCLQFWAVFLKDFVLSQLFLEKVKRIIWQLKKKAYLCKCYPENNLFTLE